MREIAWIHIHDEFPPDHTPVVLYSAGSYYPPCIGFWECGYGFTAVGGDRRTVWNVTHWMPLPKEVPVPSEKDNPYRPKVNK